MKWSNQSFPVVAPVDARHTDEVAVPMKKPICLIIAVTPELDCASWGVKPSVSVVRHFTGLFAQLILAESVGGSVSVSSKHSGNLWCKVMFSYSVYILPVSCPSLCCHFISARHPKCRHTNDLEVVGASSMLISSDSDIILAAAE